MPATPSALELLDCHGSDLLVSDLGHAGAGWDRAGPAGGGTGSGIGTVFVTGADAVGDGAGDARERAVPPRKIHDEQALVRAVETACRP